jgi:hypothetical protein
MVKPLIGVLDCSFQALGSVNRHLFPVNGEVQPIHIVVGNA